MTDMNKTVLILVDGMRPDSLEACGHPFVKEMLYESVYFPAAQTVMPSVTLPCHMSLFHSVEPGRHGILTNTYVPQVRPVNGICEVLRRAGKKCALFYNWEEIKDLARPDSLAYSCYVSGHIYSYENANPRLAALAKGYIASDLPDFTFVYLGWSDAAGHNSGWMSDEYLRAVSGSWGCIETICRGIPDDYTVIVTADHGGHDRTHGYDIPEDMTIPVIVRLPSKENAVKDGGSILDIAPTVASLLGVDSDPEWEGKILDI